MLVLSRKEDQSIIVGDNVKIHVLKVSGNRVRIGIEAPNSVRILRAELDQWGESSFDEAGSSRALVEAALAVC